MAYHSDYRLAGGYNDTRLFVHFSIAWLSLGSVVAIASSALQVAAYAWYIPLVVDGSADTNPLSWLMWLVETFVGLVIYISLTNAWRKYLTEVFALIGVAIICGYLLYKWYVADGKNPFDNVDWGTDQLPTIVAGVILAFWALIESFSLLGKLPNRWEHLLVRVCMWLYLIPLVWAAYPLIRSTYEHPHAEPFGPWFLWTICFGLQVLSVWITWDRKRDSLEAYFNPIGYTATHLAVAAIVYLGN